MMQNLNDTDVQAQEIFQGLTNLESLLAEPLAREALDLGRNASAAEQHDILQRLRRSLTQYLERDGDLFYVGLLGHFSSGKSSTINSILQIADLEDARKTGLNPTDKSITLITHHNNLSGAIA